MARMKVFVSFDWEKDRRYKYLLDAWNANSGFELEYDDVTSTEINSNTVGRVKGVLTTLIQQATHTLVIVGQDANRLHPDSKLIGQRNWQIWEIEQSKAEKKKIVAVKIDSRCVAPDALKNCGVSWAMSYAYENIVQALKNA